MSGSIHSKIQLIYHLGINLDHEINILFTMISDKVKKGEINDVAKYENLLYLLHFIPKVEAIARDTKALFANAYAVAGTKDHTAVMKLNKSIPPGDSYICECDNCKAMTEDLMQQVEEIMKRAGKE